jgi:hypothetical protein
MFELSGVNNRAQQFLSVSDVIAMHIYCNACNLSTDIRKSLWHTAGEMAHIHQYLQHFATSIQYRIVIVEDKRMSTAAHLSNRAVIRIYNVDTEVRHRTQS